MTHQGIKPASAACWSDALPTELHTTHADQFDLLRRVKLITQSVSLVNLITC